MRRRLRFARGFNGHRRGGGHLTGNFLHGCVKLIGRGADGLHIDRCLLCRRRDRRGKALVVGGIAFELNGNVRNLVKRVASAETTSPTLASKVRAMARRAATRSSSRRCSSSLVLFMKRA